MGNWFVADSPNNTGQFFDPVLRLSNVSHVFNVGFCTMNGVFFLSFWENWYKRHKKFDGLREFAPSDLHIMYLMDRFSSHTEGLFFLV